MIPAGWCILTLLIGLGIGYLWRSIEMVPRVDEAWDRGWKRGHERGYEEGNASGFDEALTALERAVGGTSGSDASRPRP